MIDSDRTGTTDKKTGVRKVPQNKERIYLLAGTNEAAAVKGSIQAEADKRKT